MAGGIDENREDSSDRKRYSEQDNIKEEARQKKDWAAADVIREELMRKRIILEDKKDGTAWKIKVG